MAFVEPPFQNHVLKDMQCDGGIPACGNCQKASEPCIDVDGRNKSLLIPRDFAANARARIEWLEQHIKLLTPNFDLGKGPQVDLSFLDAAGAVSSQAATSNDLHETTQQNVASTPDISLALGKRARDSASGITSLDVSADDVRSVALDLGLLTLNSDSRQTHYLGTSSGRLFTKLIGARSPNPPTTISDDRSSGRSSIHGSSRQSSCAHSKYPNESCEQLYNTLRKSLPSEDDARTLLDVYFQNLQVDHPFLHPDSLLSAMEALYQCAATDDMPEIGCNGWPASVQAFAYNGEIERIQGVDCTPISVFTATFHVFMVFTLAATVRTHQRAFDFAPNQFYRVAMTADQHCFSETSLASLQATLLLAVHSLLGPTGLNIWTLTYVSMAHCVDLGLHRSVSDDRGLSPAAVVTRKLVFFTVYHLDRYVSRSPTSAM